LNSTPQVSARDRGAVAQGAQLGLGDLRMNALAKLQSMLRCSYTKIAAGLVDGTFSDWRSNDGIRGEPSCFRNSKNLKMNGRRTMRLARS
jgi:hypothetical protein